jgi:hypothetical protein
MALGYSATSGDRREHRCPSAPWWKDSLGPEVCTVSPELLISHGLIAPNHALSFPHGGLALSGPGHTVPALSHRV